MKITNSDVIKSGERELIDSIIGDLDWDTIEKIVKDRYKLQIQDDVEYRQGDIIVHNNQVAYKLDFDVKMTLSVVFDRDGNYLSLATSDDIEDEIPSNGPPGTPSNGRAPVLSGRGIPAEEFPAANPEKAPRDNFSKMASHIAEMISSINEE
jgi:hypothetical protein